MRFVEAPTNVIFNDDRDLVAAHEDPALDRVLHVFDANWHGIRSATACLPGGKLAISHASDVTGEDFRHVEGLIFRFGFNAVCFQGYSEKSDLLAEVLHRTFGQALPLYAVTHVSTSQFEHAFEMAMLKRIYDKVGRGVIRRAGSVKPNFYLFHPNVWSGCIMNIPPNMSRLVIPKLEREDGTVFIPVENTWRKNLYTQVIAAQGSDLVKRVMLVNWPSQLDQLMPLRKIQVIGFQQLHGLLANMSLAKVVMNASFAECQPMMQLEALTVGTPTITGPLRLPGFSDHPLSKLCEVTELDDPGLLRRRLDNILQEWRIDPQGLSQMISEFVRLRVTAGLASYKEFMEISG